MRSVGIDVIIGYGLSETTATVSCFREVGYEIGTAGKPLPGIDVKISDEGEILVKGPTVTPVITKIPRPTQPPSLKTGISAREMPDVSTCRAPSC